MFAQLRPNIIFRHVTFAADWLPPQEPASQMSSPERFFEALNGPPPAAATKTADGGRCRKAGRGHKIPEHDKPTGGAAARTGTTLEIDTAQTGDATASEGRPASQFLAQARVASYVRFLETDARTYHPAFDFFDADHDWDGSHFPLNLCEFLAYKSALAYRGRRQIEDNLMREHARGITHFAFFEHQGRHGDTQGYGFVVQDTAYVVFRGTEFLTLADWVTDFDTALTTELDAKRYGELEDRVGARQPGRHTGFARAYGSVRAEIETWATKLLDGGMARRIVFAGHSLGGALAILAAHDFADRLGRVHEIGAVITFGAPMVGGEEFQRAYDDTLGLKNRTVRIAASLDLVTLLTLAPESYRHVGRLWHLNKRPAYSYWRMYFFTPLWSPDEEAEKKTKDRKRRHDAGGEADEDWDLKSMLVRWALKAVWFVIKLFRRAIAAHSVNRNYALYLTVRSYQGLRKHLSSDYDSAHKRLLDHLVYVRGRNGGLFGVARKGPLKVASPSEEAKLARQFVHFIV